MPLRLSILLCDSTIGAKIQGLLDKQADHKIIWCFLELVR